MMRMRNFFRRFFRYHHRGVSVGAKWMINRVANHLVLRPEQRQRLVELQEQMQTFHFTLNHSRHDSAKVFAELLNRDVLDREEAMSLFRERQRLMENQAEPVVEAFAEFYDNLEPVQRERLRQRFLRHVDNVG